MPPPELGASSVKGCVGQEAIRGMGDGPFNNKHFKMHPPFSACGIYKSRHQAGFAARLAPVHPGVSH